MFLYFLFSNFIEYIPDLLYTQSNDNNIRFPAIKVTLNWWDTQ